MATTNSRFMLLLLISSAMSSFTLAYKQSQNAAFPEGALPTESGYLLVNKTSGARMFYAYYEAISPVDKLSNTPIILWLQGGPGCSGMIANFYELGPWRVGDDILLHQNEAPWNRLFGVLFLDNPVGAGFSIAPNVDDIPTNEDAIARDVYTALQGFFDRHELFRDRPFYVTGESYAGKYVPAVGSYILAQNKQQVKLRKIAGLVGKPLRLDGVAIGNGLTHPIAQVRIHASTAYSMGLIDEKQRSIVDKLADRVVYLIQQEDWFAAHAARSEVLEYLLNTTGLATLLDVRRGVDYYTTESGVDILAAFLNKAEVQTVLKTEAKVWESCSRAVSHRMANDTMKSTKSLVEGLLPRVPVLLYQGQFDLQDGVASTEAWMELVEWPEMGKFFAAERSVWKVNGIVAGYVRSHATLTHVVISNAGHLVPTDQNYHSQLMIEGWISGTGFI